jgi:hypothetical protein
MNARNKAGAKADDQFEAQKHNKYSQRKEKKSRKQRVKEREELVRKTAKKVFKARRKQAGEHFEGYDSEELFEIEDALREEFESKEKTEIAKKMAKRLNLAANLVRKGHNVDALLEKTKLLETPKVRRVVELDSCLPQMTVMLELAISDKQGLLSYLSQPDTVEFMVNTDYAILKASLEAALQKRYSPLNIRVHMLWQFSTTIHEVESGDTEKNLKLAMHGYSVLHTMLEKWSESKNDPDLHMTEYAALDNTHKLAKMELARYLLLHASLDSNKMDVLKSDVNGRTGV